ncbi:MAG: GTPase ObgE [Bacilli bacterium]|jgi:GTP-binding protein|nr:GTPase ObgE [Bacilli bacterium]MDD2682244.1 GTPase ObgE [Bacilli bacterium]MDD3121458.1 GTPase ObgE [Bacilli bacterium]MDD4063503.1 GTPase ObgE [Bacilli bacterium]MDD4481997.1 GTPase ObgE [Bacilli bacterium]
MFIDEVKITVKAGKGGNGIVAFRREKYVPKGGPAGGDGGNGGSVIFVGESGLTTLLDLRYNKVLKAADGENGMAKNCFGKAADNIYVKVPLGTVIYDEVLGSVIADITKHGQEVVICKGGKGGRGNSSFATSRVPAPYICESGLPGEEKSLKIELKVLADVGLVGLPNAGKSTLISVVSAAKPKIANYPFTTLVPNLGVVGVKDGRSFVMADLPGLIEGASIGAGLGLNFLKHIERTRVIAHVIDMDPLDKSDPYNNYLIINKELENYDKKLLLRPQVIVANKMDLPNSLENLEKFKKECKNIPIIPISAYNKDNINALLYKLADLLDTVSLNEFVDDIKEEIVEYIYKKPEAPFVITLGKDGIYNVTGPVVKRYFDITDFSRDDNVKLFAQKIRNLGVDEELKNLGVKNGDTVRIFDFEFEFFD